jgi:hypothetical protein
MSTPAPGTRRVTDNSQPTGTMLRVVQQQFDVEYFAGRAWVYEQSYHDRRQAEEFAQSPKPTSTFAVETETTT